MYVVLSKFYSGGVPKKVRVWLQSRSGDIKKGLASSLFPGNSEVDRWATSPGRLVKFPLWDPVHWKLMRFYFIRPKLALGSK